MQFLKNVIGLALSFLILFAIGCERHLDDNTIFHTVIDVESDISPLAGSVFIGEAETRFGTDSYDLREVTISGDALMLTASYGGGCKAHQFTLIASQEFLESDPVQMNVSVVHDANDDRCEAWLTETYAFDLTAVKTLYQDAYGKGAGTIIFRLEGVPDRLLVYEFTM